MVHHFRLDDPHSIGSEDEYAAIAGVFELPVFDDDASPYAGLQSMVAKKSGGNGRFIKMRRLLVGLRRSGNRRHVAEEAIEFCAEFVLPTVFREDPGSLLPRRVVPNVLRMLAIEVRDPDAVRILMKTYDFSVHGEEGEYAAERASGRSMNRPDCDDAMNTRGRLVSRDVGDGARQEPSLDQQCSRFRSSSLSWNNRIHRRK